MKKNYQCRTCGKTAFTAEGIYLHNFCHHKEVKFTWNSAKFLFQFSLFWKSIKLLFTLFIGLLLLPFLPFYFIGKFLLEFFIVLLDMNGIL